MSTPTGLVLAPPCHALAPRTLGAFTITAQLASGRRADVYLGHSVDRPGAPLRLRVPHAGQDARAFVREAQRSISWGGPGSVAGVEEAERGVVAWGAPVVGESLAVILDALLTEGVPLPVELAISISMGVAERLGKGARRVHGDLAPHHVIVGYDGSVALIDPAGPDEAAERASAIGRLGYRSPEHVKGEPVAALRTLGRWLSQVHLKDATRTRIPGTWGEEVPVGTGEVAWPAFFQTLRELGYAGDLCLEREAGTQRVADLRSGAAFVARLGG